MTVPAPTLEQWQSALVDVVVLGADPALLPGADPSRLLLAREQLTSKHAGIVRHRWPGLAAALGPHWFAVYEQWERGRPWQGPTVAGVGLAEYVVAQEESPVGAEARHEAAVILRDWQVRNGTARPRLGLRLRRAWRRLTGR